MANFSLAKSGVLLLLTSVLIEMKRFSSTYYTLLARFALIGFALVVPSLVSAESEPLYIEGSQVAKMTADMEALERRVAQLEARLANTEQATREIKKSKEAQAIKAVKAVNRCNECAAPPAELGCGSTSGSTLGPTANSGSVTGSATGDVSPQGVHRGASLDLLAKRAWRNLRWTQKNQWDGIEKGTSIETVVEKLGVPPRTVKSLKPRVDLVYFYETSLRDSVNGVRGKIAFKDGVVTTVAKPDFSQLSASPSYSGDAL
jgi:hypothetical protein